MQQQCTPCAIAGWAVTGILSIVIVVYLLVTDGAVTLTQAMTSMAPNMQLASFVECALDTTADVHRMRERLLVEANRRPAVAYATYAGAPSMHAGRRVTIGNADFARGPVRARTSVVFELVDDVLMSHNTSLHVEASKVLIALGGHTLACATTCVLIHVHNGTSSIVLEHGTLGRSSTSILIDGARRVLVSDLVAREYSRAALVIERSSDVLVERVSARGSSTHVPLRAAFDAALVELARLESEAAAARLPESETLRENAHARRVLIEHALDDVARHGAIDAAAHPDAFAAFDNAHRLSDVDGGALVVRASERVLVRETDVRATRTSARADAVLIDSSASVCIDRLVVAGVTGASARGLVLANASDVCVRQLRLEQLNGTLGDAVAFDIRAGSRAIYIGPLSTIDNVVAAGLAVGVRVDEHSASSVFGARAIAIANVGTSLLATSVYP